MLFLLAPREDVPDHADHDQHGEHGDQRDIEDAPPGHDVLDVGGGVHAVHGGAVGQGVQEVVGVLLDGLEHIPVAARGSSR